MDASAWRLFFRGCFKSCGTGASAREFTGGTPVPQRGPVPHAEAGETPALPLARRPRVPQRGPVPHAEAGETPALPPGAATRVPQRGSVPQRGPVPQGGSETVP